MRGIGEARLKQDRRGGRTESAVPTNLQFEFIKLRWLPGFLLKGKYSRPGRVKRLIFGARIARDFFIHFPRFFTHIVFSYLTVNEVIVVAWHALPAMAFRHSIKRAYRRPWAALLLEFWSIHCRFPLQRFRTLPIFHRYTGSHFCRFFYFKTKKNHFYSRNFSYEKSWLFYKQLSLYSRSMAR